RVRGVMKVGFDDGGVDAQAPAADDAVLARQGHQAGEDVLEYRFVQQLRQPDQCLRVRNTFSVDPAERAIDQASPDLSLAFLEAPVGEIDRKSTRLNSSHGSISYAVFCLKKKKK